MPSGACEQFVNGGKIKLAFLRFALVPINRYLQGITVQHFDSSKSDFRMFVIISTGIMRLAAQGKKWLPFYRKYPFHLCHVVSPRSNINY